MNSDKWPLFRIIVPKFPHINIFSRAAKETSDLGSVMLATMANKVWGWNVEIINENNWRGPKDKNGLPDHKALQKENPAKIVGFCCGLSSTIERVWELAFFYKSLGVLTIAGGWHAHYCPEETLRHNIDLVVHGDGEPVIGRILINADNMLPLYLKVKGCSFIKDDKVVHNNQLDIYQNQIPDMDKALANLRNEVKDLDDLPYPDFGFLKHARIKFYPICRNKGCKFNCEFCSVRGKVRSASALYLFKTVNWLVETRRAKNFFIVDDRLEEDIEGTIEFFRLVKQKYGNRLNFFAQIRLESADNSEFITAMAEAGVKTVFIGFESPIDEDLIIIRKGYLSQNMLIWTKILRKYFWIHGMFIFGYPPKDGKSPITAKQMAKQFKWFLKKAKLSSIQILKAIPVVGSDLRKRLENDGVLFPLSLVPWRYYDGNWAGFMPKNMTLKEFQEIPIQLMSWFYSSFSIVKVCLRTIAFPIDYIVRGWGRWKRGWYKDVVKWAASRLMKKWQKKCDSKDLFRAMEDYCQKRGIS